MKVSASLQFLIGWRRKTSPQELDEVEGETGDSRDHCGLPHKVHGLDELGVCKKDFSKSIKVRNRQFLTLNTQHNIVPKNSLSRISERR